VKENLFFSSFILYLNFVFKDMAQVNEPCSYFEICNNLPVLGPVKHFLPEYLSYYE
jgi:hypothetical protein